MSEEPEKESTVAPVATTEEPLVHPEAEEAVETVECAQDQEKPAAEAAETVKEATEEEEAQAEDAQELEESKDLVNQESDASEEAAAPVEQEAPPAEPEEAPQNPPEPEGQVADFNFAIDGFEEDSSPFAMLTPDLVLKIFEFLDIPELLNVQLVCQEWMVYAKSDAIWSVLYDSTPWELSLPSTVAEAATWYDLYRLHYLKEAEGIDDAEPELFDLLQDTSDVSPDKLRTLLELEEFVLALQSGEDAVLTFLEAPSTIIAMMNLLFKEPSDPEDMQNQRIIHITVQTLVSGIITDVFIMNTDLLHILFDHLDELDLVSPGAHAKSGCISKVISILFEKFTMQMIEHFQSREAFVPSLLLYIHDTNIMEMLYKFVDCDLTHQWLFDADIMTRLVALLHQDETVEIQEHAANVLVSILSLCQSWPQSVLVNDMLNNQVITGSIIAYMEAKPLNGESVKLGLRVLIGILSLISDELEDPPAVVTLLANSIGFFTKILLDPEDMDNKESFTTTTGKINRGFGFVRLGVLELLVSLLYTGFPNVVEFMLQEKVFPVILDLLFQFPWNNIIHNQISQLFSGLFCCNNPEVIITVMEDCRLPERIAEAHKSETSVGFLGHLRELANELVRAGKMSDAISDYLETKSVWLEFVEDDLKEFNLVECVVQDDYLDYENQYFEEEQFEEYEILEDADELEGVPYEEYSDDTPQEY